MASGVSSSAEVLFQFPQGLVLEVQENDPKADVKLVKSKITDKESGIQNWKSVENAFRSWAGITGYTVTIPCCESGSPH